MVAVFKVNGLGDNVVFVPALQALRSKLPWIPITLVTTPSVQELYNGVHAPNALVTVEKTLFNNAYRNPFSLAAWIMRARSWKPSACLLPFDQGSVAHFVARCSGARIIVGGNSGNAKISAPLTSDVPLPADSCLATWNWNMALSLARSLGDRSEWPERPPAPDLRHLLPGERIAGGPKSRIVVHAGAAKGLNQWSPALFASVATALSRDFEVTWISHAETAQNNPDGCTIRSVVSLAELAKCISGADLFLGNNSGPMHVANALGCAGVAVTGPSALGWNPYWHPERWTVLRHPNLYCAPCERPDRGPPVCINAKSPMACMHYWTADMVEAACRKRLGRQAVGPT